MPTSKQRKDPKATSETKHPMNSYLPEKTIPSVLRTSPRSISREGVRVLNVLALSRWDICQASRRPTVGSAGLSGFGRRLCANGHAQPAAAVRLRNTRRGNCTPSPSSPNSRGLHLEASGPSCQRRPYMNCPGSRGSLSRPCRGIDATLHANGGDEDVSLWLPDAGLIP